jgi:hypothetical protein
MTETRILLPHYENVLLAWILPVSAPRLSERHERSLEQAPIAALPP